MPNKRKQSGDPEAEARRAEQNRQHQKAFREKRKARMQLLEERVAELERELAVARSHCQLLDPAAAPEATPPTSASTPSASTAFAEALGSTGGPDYTLPPLACDVHRRLAEMEAENEALKAMLSQQIAFGIQAAEAAADPSLAAASSGGEVRILSSNSQIQVQIPQAQLEVGTVTPKDVFNIKDSQYRDVESAADDAWDDLLNLSDSDNEDEEDLVPPKVEHHRDKLDRNEAVVPTPVVTDMRRELKQVPSLQEADDLIDDICNYINNHDLLAGDPGQFVKDVTQRKSNLINHCKTEQDQTAVYDILDRSRKQNEAVVNRIMQSAKIVKPVEPPPILVPLPEELNAKISKDVARLDALRTVASLNTPECLEWIAQLELQYKNWRETHPLALPGDVDEFTIGIFNLKHNLLNKLVDDNERKRVLEILIIFYEK